MTSIVFDATTINDARITVQHNARTNTYVMRVFDDLGHVMFRAEFKTAGIAIHCARMHTLDHDFILALYAQR